MSTLKVDTINTTDGSGNITFSRPTVLTAGDIATADIADDAVTLAKMAGGTDGNIISYDASGDPVAVVTGSSGQVLTSAGAGAPPTFAAAAAGGSLVYIETVTISSPAATADFLTSFSSTYDDYLVMYNNIIPVSNTQIFTTRITVSGSVQSGGSDYTWAILGIIENNSENHTSHTGSSYTRIMSGAPGTAAGDSCSGGIWYRGVNNTANYKVITFEAVQLDSSSQTRYHTGGGAYMGSTSAWSGCQIATESGNIESGIFNLYGLAKS